LPFGLTNAATLYAKFVRMMGYGPTSFYYHFSNDNLLSQGSSIGDLSPLSCPALQEYTMVDVQGRLPVPVETEDTHMTIR
jgi:hypothetical protein